jgi:hypothetical protein
MALYVGADGKQPSWNGYTRLVYLNLGSQAFLDVTHEDVIGNMFHLQSYIREVSVELRLDDDSLLINSPSDANNEEDKKGPVFEHHFEEEVESSTEYSVSVWARWLTTYPTRLLYKEAYHSIFRLAEKIEYQDAADMGDRTLSAFVARGSYLFSTYDENTNRPAVNVDIPYHNELEGQWNLIHFSYKKFTEKPQASAFVYFSHTDVIASQAFMDIYHHIHGSQAVFKLSIREFKYQPFHGQLYDARVTFGAGSYVEDADEFRDVLSAKYPLPPPDSTPRVDFEVRKEELRIVHDQE